MLHKCVALIAVFMVYAGIATAGPADVEDVQVRAEPGGSFYFDVTVRHHDEGWDHYADRWQVVGEDGVVYGERVLLHPHVNEQPFTRSQGGISVPKGLDHVKIRAHDKRDGFGGAEITVQLPGR